MAKAKPQATISKNVPFWQNEKVMAWLFFGLAFLLYVQTVGYDYALDDRAVTFQNKFVMKGFAGIGDILKTFYWAGFWDSNAGLFRPLSLILFAIEWKLFPNHPHVYHFVNVVLYAVCAMLLYKTLRQLFRDFSLTLPVLATLLWIVFPAHTEVVANIKSGDEILSMIFFLLTMLQLLKWSADRSMKALALAGTFFFLSLLSKEGAVLFLPIFFMAIYLFRKIEVKQLVKPALILVGVTAIWFAWHSVVIANAPTEKIKYTYHDNSLVAAPDLGSRVATAMQMQGKYLLKSFTSFPLSWDYSYNENPNIGFLDLTALLSTLVCVGLFAFAILKFKKNPILSFGILFYFISFALTSNVFMLIGATMADRFLFVPSVGFAIALTWIVLQLTKGEHKKQFHANAFYILIPLTLLYGIRTYSRSSVWKDESTLYSTDVENSPSSGRVHSNYGMILKSDAIKESNRDLQNQKFDLAFNEFLTAYKIDSLDYASCANMGDVKFLTGHFPESVYWRTRALQIEPRYSIVLTNLGNSLMQCHKYDSAIVIYKEAIQAKSSDSLTWMHIGDSYLMQHDTVSAINAFENDVKQFPKYAEAWNKLANVCGMHKDLERSSEAFLELTKLDPNNVNAYRMLYTNYNLMGDTVTANKYAKEYYQRVGK